MSIIKSNQLMFVRDVTGIYCDKHKYSLCGQNLEFRNVAAGGYRQWPQGCERLRYCLSICLMALRKITRKLCQESQCPVGFADRLLVRSLATCSTCAVVDSD